jgi:hypothetical protein
MGKDGTGVAKFRGVSILVNNTNPGDKDGKCRRCKITITLSDTVVSNGNGRGYYHKFCAEKLHIL